MAETYRYYGVLLSIPIEQPILTYRWSADETDPESLVGRVVLVPLGIGKVVSGVVWSYQGTESPLATGRVKGIRTVLSYPALPPAVRRFWSWMASYYMCSLGDVLRAALPSAFRPEGGQKYQFADSSEEAKALGKPVFNLKELKKVYPDDYVERFADWVERGIVSSYEGHIDSAKGIIKGWGVSEEVLEAPCRAEMEAELKGSRKSLAALDALTGIDPEHFFATLGDLETTLSVSAHVIGRLRAVGAIKEVAEERYRVISSRGKRQECGVVPDFGGKSILVLHQPDSRVRERLPLQHLYDLVCGSQAQVLLLLPSMEVLDEVEGLLEQTVGDLLRPYHMGVSARRREQAYLEAWRGEAGLYVGLRAATWLPLPALTEVVILDPEHRGYRQWEPAPRFTASDAALVLGAQSGARSLLVSAHPSVECMAQVMRGKYALQTVPAPARTEPVTVQTASLQQAIDDHQLHARLLSDMMVSAIRFTISHGGTVLLLYQRQGYARSVKCSSCSEPLLCPRCHVPCRLSHDAQQLECSLCGYRAPVPSRCPRCAQEGTLTPSGTGVYRLREAIGCFFRGVRVSIYEEEGADPGGIVLSTSFDPPLALLRRVAMVGIIQLDLSLTLPDYRAGERTYRMLSDCRSELSDGSRMVIQYFTPSVALDAFLQEDYRLLVDHEMKERHLLLLPPFCRQLDLVVEGRSQSLIQAFARRVYRELSERIPQVQLLEPSPLPVSKREASFGFRLSILIPLDRQLSPLKDLLSREVTRMVAQSGIKYLHYYYDVDP